MENFTDSRVNMVPITQANARLLLSDYEARVPGELPVYVFARRGSLLVACTVTPNDHLAPHQYPSGWSAGSRRTASRRA